MTGGFARPIVGLLMKNRISICSLLALLFTGFALPCSAFIPTDGTFYGLFFQTNTYWQNSSGTIRITTRHTGSYSANLKIGSRSYSYSGTLASDGSAVRQILRSYDY